MKMGSVFLSLGIIFSSSVFARNGLPVSGLYTNHNSHCALRVSYIESETKINLIQVHHPDGKICEEAGREASFDCPAPHYCLSIHKVSATQFFLEGNDLIWTLISL